MARVRAERLIAAPVERVFSLSTDLRNAPEVISSILRLELLTEGPVGRGTRWRETRMMFNREATEEMEILEFDPPRRYLVGAGSHGCVYRTEFSFSPEGPGTRAVMSFQARPVSLAAKVMSPMMMWMMRAAERECSQDLDDIKAAAEA